MAAGYSGQLTLEARNQKLQRSRRQIAAVAAFTPKRRILSVEAEPHSIDSATESVPTSSGPMTLAERSARLQTSRQLSRKTPPDTLKAPVAPIAPDPVAPPSNAQTPRSQLDLISRATRLRQARQQQDAAATSVPSSFNGAAVGGQRVVGNDTVTAVEGPRANGAAAAERRRQFLSAPSGGGSVRVALGDVDATSKTFAGDTEVPPWKQRKPSKAGGLTPGNVQQPSISSAGAIQTASQSEMIPNLKASSLAERAAMLRGQRTK